MQHMVMTGASTHQSESSKPQPVAAQQVAAKQDKASASPSNELGEEVAHNKSRQGTTNKPTVNQRTLNNWAVDTATSLFSYSSTHLERDKKNNAELCKLMAWAEIQEKLFQKPGALLRAVSDKHIDSKAFAVGPPIFLTAEKNLESTVYWVKVPIMLVMYYPEEQKKGLLQVKMGITTQQGAWPFVLHKMVIEKMPTRKATEDLLP